VIRDLHAFTQTLTFPLLRSSKKSGPIRRKNRASAI
jgi:hypothetical protein